MGFGLDYVAGPPAATLKTLRVDGNPISFVCRYLSFVNSLTQVKILSPSEAKSLGDNGIAIVSNYEWYADRATESAASGVQDAQIAVAQHAACGGPSDRPIYFSVDADVDGAQTVQYFRGVASILGLERTGAYGSYRVIKYLLDNHLIQWAWQTYAWSGGQWEPRAHIRQYQNGVSLAGHSVDYDQSMQADYGQWMPGQQGGEILLQLTDPIGKHFTSNAADDRWHCIDTNQDIAYALLSNFRKYGGVYGFPLTGEIYLADYPGTALQYHRSGIAAYDPPDKDGKRKIDNTVIGSDPCYLLRLDSGIGQQAIAKPLLTTLQAQADTLAKQVATLTDELAQAQQKPDTSALEAQLAAANTQLEAYKQAIASTEATFAALPK